MNTQRHTTHKDLAFAGNGAIPAAGAWDAAGAARDLGGDAVFDCRGLRPSAAFGDDGLPPGCVGPRGWVAVDDSWRLADGAGNAVFDGRVYVVGDVADKPPAQRTAVDAAEEGEYAAACIARHARGRRPPKPYAPPPSVCAISLGKRDGVVVAGSRVLLRGRAAAAAKGAVQYWAVRFLPKPVTVWRRARR